MKTLVISKKEIPPLLPMPQLIKETRDAYVNYSSNKAISPQRHISQIHDTFFEIADVVNAKIGRSSYEEITVFGNIGLAFQDLVACSIIYKNALELRVGQWIDLDDSH